MEPATRKRTDFPERAREYIPDERPEEGPFWRHEYKYEIDVFQEEMLRSVLDEIMEPDREAGTEGLYHVRSLYFDDAFDSCYYDNENGADLREKFRLRLYNGSAEFIRLELKRKEAGMTLKRSCRVSVEQAGFLSEGGILDFSDDMDPLLKKFCIQQQLVGLVPKMIVEYERIPFVCPDGNVRVTFDKNVFACPETESFLCAEIAGRPVFPEGKELLEVKFDTLLPDHIRHSIQKTGVRQTAFSKYYLSRRFGGFA